MLDVYLHGKLAGHVYANPDDPAKLQFYYADQFLNSADAVPLSLAMPLSRKRYNNDVYFQDLLPQGEILTQCETYFKVSGANPTLSLLEHLGGDCQGAVTFYPHQETASNFAAFRPISLNQIEDLLYNAKPLAIEENVRLCLAGTQRKLPVYIEQQQYYLPMGHFISSHILKISPQAQASLCQNEFFVNRLAKALGLHVPEVELLNSQQPMLQIQRFDRKRDANGVLQALHQETIGQISAENMQKLDLVTAINLIRQYSAEPVLDLKQLIQWVIFNVLVGNTNAHGGHVAFLLLLDGPKLAPFYDLCALMLNDFKPAAVFNIGGENRLDQIKLENWQLFAEQMQIKPKWLFNFIRDFNSRIVRAAKDLRDDLAKQQIEHGVFDQIIDFISAQVQRSDNELQKQTQTKAEFA